MRLQRAAVAAPAADPFHPEAAVSPHLYNGLNEMDKLGAAYIPAFSVKALPSQVNFTPY